MDGWYGGGCKQALLYFKLAFVNEVLDFIYWACSSTHKTHWNARFHDTLLNAQFKTLNRYLWTWSSASIISIDLVYYEWLTLLKNRLKIFIFNIFGILHLSYSMSRWSDLEFYLCPTKDGLLNTFLHWKFENIITNVTKGMTSH